MRIFSRYVPRLVPYYFHSHGSRSPCAARFALTVRGIIAVKYEFNGYLIEILDTVAIKGGQHVGTFAITNQATSREVYRGGTAPLADKHEEAAKEAAEEWITRNNGKPWA